ncbi:MAG: hypothetical protein EXX96DRAFT_498993 [Benjaminiella poitrasii]|nr:MAG: hypothetical protein EXX96DRAFT_498993 [Benjaminiella poitrasii]
MNDNLEYDPKHKASSITSTTSTSSNSTWDHPLSYVPSSYLNLKDLAEEDPLAVNVHFEDYDFISSELILPKSIPIPSFNFHSHPNESIETDSSRAGFITISARSEEPLESNSLSFISQNNDETKIQRTSNEENFCENTESNRSTNHGKSLLDYASSSYSKTVNSSPVYLQDCNQIALSSFANLYDRKHVTYPKPSSFTADVIQDINVNRQHSSTKKRARESLSPSSSRDILTEDEKRMNHIVSEQKRRNTIRSGFKELTEIIPTLKNINNSKSTILFKAVEYIKHLDKRNRGLREKFTSLQTRIHILQGRLGIKEQIGEQQHQLLSHNKQRLVKKLFGKRRQQEDIFFMSQQQQQQQPSATLSALLVHKNQQKQLEQLQEQLRLQQLLLEKHNIILPNISKSNSSSVTLQDNSILSSKNDSQQALSMQYNSIFIPSSRSSNSDENESHLQEDSPIIPHDMGKRRPWDTFHQD